MNTTELKGDWNITQGKLRRRWARLTDDDLNFVDGRMELCARIQKRTGETHESVEKTISPFSKTAAVIDPSSSRIAIYGKSWAIYAMKLTAFESIVPPLLRPEPGRSGSTGVQK